MFGPLAIAAAAIYPILFPVAISEGRRIASLHLPSILLSVSALGVAVLIHQIPDSIGVRLLGETWETSSELFLLYGLALSASLLGTAAMIGLRSAQRQRTVLSVAIFTLPAYLLLAGFPCCTVWRSGFRIGTFSGRDHQRDPSIRVILS